MRRRRPRPRRPRPARASLARPATGPPPAVAARVDGVGWIYTPWYRTEVHDMRLPKTANTSRPWRIHELPRDFRLEDVWALPTPGGPDDFPRLARLAASGVPFRSSSGLARTLFAI